MEEFCTYCGLTRGDRISCCGENHFMTAQEFRDYYGEWPEDYEEEGYEVDAAGTFKG